MADFTASRSSGNLGLAYRICREVVLVHISLLRDVRIESLNSLCFGERSQCADINDLRLASRKHSGAVHSGNQADFRVQRTDLCDFTAVRTLVILEDHLADGLLLILVNRVGELCKICFIIRESFLQSFRDRGYICFTGLFVVRENSSLHLFLRYDLLHILEHLIRNSDRNIVLLLLAAVSRDRVVERDQLAVYSVCLIDIIDHVRFRNLVRAGFDHDNLFRRGSNSKTQIAEIPVLLGRVDDDLSVNKTDLRSRAGTRERDVGNRSRERSTHHGNQLGTALRIHTHDHAFKRHVISHVLREKRAHRPVDDTAGQNGIFRSLSLSLIETAGHLPDRVILLGIFHRKREKIHPVPGCGRLCCRAEDCCIAVVHESASVCLLADSSDIYRKGASRKLHGIGGVTIFPFNFVICHFSSPSSAARQPMRPSSYGHHFVWFFRSSVPAAVSFQDTDKATNKPALQPV